MRLRSPALLANSCRAGNNPAVKIRGGLAAICFAKHRFSLKERKCITQIYGLCRGQILFGWVFSLEWNVEGVTCLLQRKPWWAAVGAGGTLMPAAEHIGGVAQQRNRPYRADAPHFVCYPQSLSGKTEKTHNYK